MLSDTVFENDAILNSVSAGSKRLMKGEQGKHIERLQAALTKAEFPTFDPKGSYSSGTETSVKSLKDYYLFYFYLPDDRGDIVDQEFINNLDAALNGRIRSTHSRPGVPGTRLASATACLPETRNWIQMALIGCELAGQIVSNKSVLDITNKTHVNLLAAFYLHFRLSLLKDSFLIPAFLPFNIPPKLVKEATLAELRHIVQILLKLKQKSTQPAGDIYVETGPHSTTPNALASARFGGPRINLHPPFVGRSRDSICWITIHEMVHIFVSSPHDDSHPYATNAKYLTLTAAQCKNNPDCYSHFATQIVKGKPQLTPW